MAELVTFRTELIEADKPPGLGVALSIGLHLIIFAALFVAFNRIVSSEIVAAGPGEGGEGGGGSIEVGVADKSAFSASQSLSLFLTSAIRTTLSTMFALKPPVDQM